MSDLISRQDVIDKFEPWLKVKGYNEGELNMLKAVLYELKFLPSAQPEQTGGRVMSGFVTRVEPEKEEPFTVIFTTDDHSKYIHIENECRKMIGHAKDAVPVKHGEWIVKGQDIFCSVCGEESAYTWHGASKFSNYCPNCGAKMDGGKDDGMDS